MALQCNHSVEVHCSPEKAFAFIDDLPQTPKWLGPCTAIEKLSPGPNAVGDKLKYSYNQGGKDRTMEGEILERVEPSKLVCRYFDSMFEVLVDLNVQKSPSGAVLQHVITMTPKSFFAKLLSPLIRMGLPKQTRDAMAALKSLLESE